ncbi:uncharacterized protein LOC117914418 [Vitis riparia]|uniref:uncharacterized protein LOC117914418 n=1 Tax=Vitis riparia TaxID=96939 RepID=UPI00155A1ABB|nr:uncharacterized protein LOC117914418 [Vitis riparia]
MERRQWENERQMQILFQETRKLREENDVLRNRSSPQPQHYQWRQGPHYSQGAPLPREASPTLEAHQVWPVETPVHAYRAQRDESSGSTRVSSKLRHEKRPQLSDAMYARLGPQTSHKNRPHATVLPEVRSEPSSSPTLQGHTARPLVAQSGKNPLYTAAPGSISKRLDDMLSTPFSSPRHKQNISTLQNLKMQENETLREFVKRFGQAVLQVELYSIDAILQIFKRSISSGTTFFESLAKKPPTTMDELFQRASKYSMLEDDIRAATQQVLVTGQTTKNEATKSYKAPNHPGSSNRGWPVPIRSNPSERDRNKRCDYHKDHGHTTETCISLRYMIEELLKAGHLKQYVRAAPKGGESPHSRGPSASAAPIRAMINYIYGGPLDDKCNSKRKKQRLLRAATVQEHVSPVRPGLVNGSIHPIDGTIVFPAPDPSRVLQPHRDALILTIGVGNYDVKRILIDPGSSADLLQVAVIKRMGFEPSNLENPGRTLSGFNGSSTTSLGDIILPVYAGPVILNSLFSVVEDLSSFNAILGRTWLHGMKAIPSTYHQRVSFITQDGQINLYGSQLAARQCYQVARKAESSTNCEHPSKEVGTSDQ